MLIIRETQMQVMNSALLHRFRLRLRDHLTGAFPERAGALGDDGLLALIDGGIAKASGYGILVERDVTRFVAWMLTLGEGFDGEGWARSVLEDPSLDGEARARRLDERATVMAALGPGGGA